MGKQYRIGENSMVTTSSQNYSQIEKPKARASRSRRRIVDVEARNQTVEQYLPLVKAIALDISSSTTANVEYDDLVSVGVFGLIDAARSFDVDRNVKFSTYCKRRIRGSMLDELRNLDWVPRLARQRSTRLKKAQAALESKLERKPDTEELAAELDVDMNEFVKITNDASVVNVVSLDHIAVKNDDDSSQHETIENRKAPNPFHELQKKDSRNFITKSLTKLERLIVTLYYYEQLTMRQIGEMLNLSESRVSQIHTEVLGHLKERIQCDRDKFRIAI